MITRENDRSVTFHDHGADSESGGTLTRRDFVKAAAGTAAFGAEIRIAGAGTGMYVSLNGSLTGGKAGWPEFARLAARTGFGGVDVNLAAAMKEGAESTRALFSELKIK